MSPESVAAYELSPQQRQVFVSDRQEEVAGIAVLIEGDLNPAKLHTVCEGLVAKYEILRTAFQRRTGMRFPFQVILERVPLLWSELDFSSMPEREQLHAIDQLIRSASWMNLEEGRTTKFALAKLKASRHALVFCSSILCVDDFSLGIVARALENAYCDREAVDEVLQYADYSEWQNELLRAGDQEAKAGADFWNEVPVESTPALNLPFERKPAARSRQWDTVSVQLSLTPEVSLEPTLFAAWQILLSRLSGQPEFVSGHVNESRNHPEFLAAIGPFAKPLPQATHLTGDHNFSQFRHDLEARKKKTEDFQDYLPAKSLESDSPCFAVTKIAEKKSFGPLVFSELSRIAPPLSSKLQLRLISRPESASAVIDFNVAYFDQPTVAEYAESLAALFAEATSSSAPVERLSITSSRQRNQVISDFNQTSGEFSRTSTIHELFEKQVGLHPERPALRFGDTEFSAAELNQQANRIAHLLRKHGVGPNVPVALCLERSAEMIVALLGILKAGGCYVPLIPESPKPRLNHQLVETGAPVIITEQKHLEKLPEFKGMVLCLDRDRASILQESSSNPQVTVSPDDLVYIIYTSGSTGTPKGVMVRHCNLVNYSQFICRRLHLERHPEGLHFATVSTIAADLGNTCIFPALISGGCLHVIAYEMSMAPFLFGDYASRHPIDVLKITPSHLSTLLNSDAAGPVLPKKFLFLGGEAARWDLIERVQKAGHCAIFNHYGPTEATVGCCTFSVAADTSAWRPATVPIGKPITNDRVYIVDGNMDVVPAGVAGELCIGGVGLAKGYLNQPQETALRFVPDPFSGDPSARLYRTGDLARFLPDGNIEFLGRIDQQVKIRGFRVEPAEIAAALKRHPGVEHAVIVPYDSKSGEKRLAAYVVGSSRPEQLRSVLMQELPDYMVPASIVRIEALPLTPNGKLDAKKLPSPEERAAREVVAPRTPEEHKLVAIWQEVLKTDGIGVTDNFFELGGHSLLATQIISRIRNGFKVQLSLQAFLESPTISGTAAHLAVSPALGQDEEMERLLKELDGMSEEDAERLLANELAKEQAGSGS